MVLEFVHRHKLFLLLATVVVAAVSSWGMAGLLVPSQKQEAVLAREEEAVAAAPAKLSDGDQAATQTTARRVPAKNRTG